MRTSPPLEQIREFVIAGHGDLERVKTTLEENPVLLNLAYPWSETDYETAIQAASHVGNAAVAEFLLAQGAPLAIYTAAMLGRTTEVTRLLQEDPEGVKTVGAHGIPLLPHAALSGEADLVKMLFERGAQEGASMALSNAVAMGHVAVARWLLENAQPDLEWKNYQGKTALEIATESGFSEIIELIKRHGG